MIPLILKRCHPPGVGSRVDRDFLRMSFNRAFARIDAIAMGSALGLLLGGGLFLATAVLLIRQGPVVGPHLSLLSQFIPGYTRAAEKIAPCSSVPRTILMNTPLATTSFRHWAVGHRMVGPATFLLPMVPPVWLA